MVAGPQKSVTAWCGAESESGVEQVGATSIAKFRGDEIGLAKVRQSSFVTAGLRALRAGAIARAARGLPWLSTIALTLHKLNVNHNTNCAFASAHVGVNRRCPCVWSQASYLDRPAEAGCRRGWPLARLTPGPVYGEEHTQSCTHAPVTLREVEFE